MIFFYVFGKNTQIFSEYLKFYLAAKGKNRPTLWHLQAGKYWTGYHDACTC